MTEVPAKVELKSRRRDVLAGLTLFAAYVATAKLGLGLDAVSGFATFVWPPAGLSLAAMLLFGRQLWPAVAAGAFTANLLAGAPVLVALGIAGGNTLEAFAAAWALTKLFRFRPQLSRVSDVVSLVAVGAVASTAIAATVGVASLWLGGKVAPGAVGSTWRAWWIGDALGDLIVAPVLLAWSSPPKLTRPARVFIEAACLCAAALVTSLFVFDVILPRQSAADFRSPYLVFPIVIWAALRFRQRGTAVIVLLLWIASIAATVFGLGPFHDGSLSEGLLRLQGFMAVVALTAHVLGAAMAERDDARLAREEFIAVAAHELRTPLTSLNLQLQRLRVLADGAALTPEVLQTKISFLNRQVSRLTALVEDLLDVSRLMAGRIVLVPETCDLRELTAEVIERCAEQAGRVRCMLELVPGDPVVGAWDRLRMEQVVTNLLANAMKFGAGRPVRAELTSTPTEVTLCVRDEGIGISPADQARIFERFERAVEHREFGGLGLGLWISQRIVKTMGGAMSVRSQRGKGAEFIVTLPRKTEEASRTRPV